MGPSVLQDPNQISALRASGRQITLTTPVPIQSEKLVLPETESSTSNSVPPPRTLYREDTNVQNYLKKKKKPEVLWLHCSLFLPIKSHKTETMSVTKTKEHPRWDVADIVRSFRGEGNEDKCLPSSLGLSWDSRSDYWSDFATFPDLLVSKTSHIFCLPRRLQQVCFLNWRRAYFKLFYVWFGLKTDQTSINTT